MSVYPVSLLVDRNVLAAAKAICLIWHDDDLASANGAWFADRAPYERAALRVLTALDWMSMVDVEVVGTTPMTIALQPPRSSAESCST